MSHNEQEDKGFRISDRRMLKEDGTVRCQEEKKKETPSQQQQSREKIEKQTDQQQPKQDYLPEVNFISLIYSLSTSAWVQLGLVPDPTSNLAHKNLGQAKQTIDLLNILQEKTKGNLNKEEDQFLSEILYDLRLKYVEVSS
ncbi:MAG: DUF1844 domain-containing protein [bacterium]